MTRERNLTATQWTTNLRNTFSSNFNAFPADAGDVSASTAGIIMPKSTKNMSSDTLTPSISVTAGSELNISTATQANTICASVVGPLAMGRHPRPPPSLL